MSEEQTYTPEWAKHVIGRFNKRVIDQDSGEVDPQIIRMECGECKQTHRVRCTSGNVTSWVNQFARVHLHADILDPSRKVRPSPV